MGRRPLVARCSPQHAEAYEGGAFLYKVVGLLEAQCGLSAGGDFAEVTRRNWNDAENVSMASS